MKFTSLCMWLSKFQLFVTKTIHQNTVPHIFIVHEEQTFVMYMKCNFPLILFYNLHDHAINVFFDSFVDLRHKHT
jgi:hypothetical protein